jgi:CRISPR-associated protein Cas6
VSGDIVDLVFGLHGDAVALDYADRLWRAIEARLPWLADEPLAGVHPLAGVSAGNHELYLTRRAHLTLRLPIVCVDRARVLCGTRLDLGGAVEVGAATQQALSPIKTLYSSFVTVGVASEDEFLAICQEQLAAAGIPAQLVCGKAHVGRGQEDDWCGYSLMLFGLTVENWLRMQREGLGGERKRGCGIFIPHKSVAALNE